MQPTARSFADATRVFIVPMSTCRAEQLFPAIRGLPADSDVFVVVTEAGVPVLVTDTRAEAIRQVDRQGRYVLGLRH